MRRIHVIALVAVLALLAGLMAVPASAAGTATVEGTVMDTRGRPVRHAEVWLLTDAGSHYACTDKHGAYTFEATAPGLVVNGATGPAVDWAAGCANPWFMDKQFDHAYLVAFAGLAGPIPFGEGSVITVDFTVEIPEAIQWAWMKLRVGNPAKLADVCNGRGSCAEEPIFQVKAFDMSSVDFTLPADPSEYPALWTSGAAEIVRWGNWGLGEYPGAMLRYPELTDVFILMRYEDADAGAAAYQSAITPETEFYDAGIKGPPQSWGGFQRFKITKTVAADGTAVLSGKPNRTFIELLP